MDFNDINYFVAALVGSTQQQQEENWKSYYRILHDGENPPCQFLPANDANGDGHVTFDDINPFVACLVNHGCP